MAASKAQQITTAQRRAAAVELSLAGANSEQIATQLGYKSSAHVRMDIKRSLEQAVMERNYQADIMIEEELMRLARLQRAVWSPAVKGDLKAIDTALKIITMRCKLLRIDAPLQVEVSVSQLERWRNELAATEGTDYVWAEDDEPGVQALPAGEA